MKLQTLSPLKLRDLSVSRVVSERKRTIMAALFPLCLAQILLRSHTPAAVTHSRMLHTHTYLLRVCVITLGRFPKFRRDNMDGRRMF